MLTAEETILQSIDEILSETENSLAVPMTAINQAVSHVVDNNAKTIKRLTERILRAADKEVVGIDDKLDAVYTGLLGGIDAWLGDTHFLLQQLSTKGGLAEIGAPLESALLKEVTDAPKLEYGATLVLAVKEAVPWLDRMTVALERIADGMSPLERREPGEAAAVYDDDATAADELVLPTKPNPPQKQ
jgi:hypothetical protein